MTSVPHPLSPAAVPPRSALRRALLRVDWSAAANAFFAALILFSELVALGLAMAWGIVGLLRVPDLGLAALAAPVSAGALAAGIWMYRSAYVAERENRAEWAVRPKPSTGAGQARPLRPFLERLKK